MGNFKFSKRKLIINKGGFKIQIQSEFLTLAAQNLTFGLSSLLFLFCFALIIVLFRKKEPQLNGDKSYREEMKVYLIRMLLVPLILASLFTILLVTKPSLQLFLPSFWSGVILTQVFAFLMFYLLIRSCEKLTLLGSYLSSLLVGGLGLLLVNILVFSRVYSMNTLLGFGAGIILVSLSWLLSAVIYQKVTALKNDFSKLVIYQVIADNLTFITLIAGILMTGILIGTYRYQQNLVGVLFPLNLASIGIIISLLTLFFGNNDKSPLKILVIRFVVSGVISASLFYFMAMKFLNDRHIFFAVTAGIITSILVGLLIYYTQERKKHWQIDTGIFTALLLCGGLLISFKWLSGYGMLLMLVGMSAPFVPIIINYCANNSLARQIALISTKEDREEFEKGKAKKEEDLESAIDLAQKDVAGNLLSKVFSFSSIVILITVMFRCFIESNLLVESGLLDLSRPYVLVALSIGVLVPFILNAYLNDCLQRSADSIMNDTSKTIDKCIDNSLATTLREMFVTVLAQILVVSFICFVLHNEGLASFLVGLTISSLLIVFIISAGKEENISGINPSLNLQLMLFPFVSLLASSTLLDLSLKMTRVNKLYFVLGLFVLVVLVSLYQELKLSLKKVEASEEK